MEIINWITITQGCDWMIEKTNYVYFLVVFWHPETAKSAQPGDSLYKYNINMLVYISNEEDGYLSRLYSRIKRAQETGSLNCTICYLYLNNSYFLLSEQESSHNQETKLICSETLDWISGTNIWFSVLAKDKPLWILHKRMESLLDWLVTKNGLKWTLRFTICNSDNNNLITTVSSASQLYPWCLLCATWGFL